MTYQDVPWPWNDRTGRFSSFKATVFALLWLPALWLATEAALGWLGPRPLNAAIHQSGEWCIRLLLISLAVTPFRHFGRWPRLMTIRRMLGLSVLAYALLHLSLFIGDQAFDPLKVVNEIVTRFYLLIGFVVLLGLVALGVTSTDGMIRRLGGARWRRLHGMVYGLALLGLVHHFLQSKLDVSHPVLMTGIFAWLMAYRALHAKGWTSAPWLAGLAVAVASLTALIEAGWYAVKNGLPVLRILEANFILALAPRPSWWIIGSALLLALVALLMKTWRNGGWRPSPTMALTPR